MADKDTGAKATSGFFDHVVAGIVGIGAGIAGAIGTVHSRYYEETKEGSIELQQAHEAYKRDLRNLMAEAKNAPMEYVGKVAGRKKEWADFYREYLEERGVPSKGMELYTKGTMKRLSMMGFVESAPKVLAFSVVSGIIA